MEDTKPSGGNNPQQQQQQQQQQILYQHQLQQQQQRQQQMLLLQQLQKQQQQAAMARFPSNIDVHLRPPGLIQNRPINPPLQIPNPNPNPSSAPNLGPSFQQQQQQQQIVTSQQQMLQQQQQKLMRPLNHMELQVAYQDAWRVCHPDFKRPFSSVEDACERKKRKLDAGQNDEDSVLVFVPKAKWEALLEWFMKMEILKFGPVVINGILNRFMGRNKWLCNEDMNVVMYLFREKTSLGRLKLDRVGFMTCTFGMQLKNEYLKYLKNKDNHMWGRFILAYANGELPSHGKTCKKWGSDLVKIYFPLFVNNDHWISLCINFVLRTVEVLDCCGKNYNKDVEAFAITIPRIMKEIQTKAYGENLDLSPYSIIHVTVPRGLNKSDSDCGVYAIKYIECHFLNLPLDLVNDNNITHARRRIGIDLWEAATNPAFFKRMSKYEPPQLDSDVADVE